MVGASRVTPGPGGGGTAQTAERTTAGKPPFPKLLIFISSKNRERVSSFDVTREEAAREHRARLSPGDTTLPQVTGI